MSVNDFKLAGAKTTAFRTSPRGILPRSAIGLIVVGWATAAIFLFHEGSHRVVALAVVWAPYLILRPKLGLWFAPTLMMAASLLAPPEGFEWGVGYSPELIFWAIAMALSAAATTVASIRHGGVFTRDGWANLRLPAAFYAFSFVSLLGAVNGFARGYPLDNVAKQFFGCLLFLGYFWFAVKLAPTLGDMEQVIKAIVVSCSLLSLLWVVSYIYTGSFVHDTIMADYAGSVGCLLLPQFLNKKWTVRMNTLGVTMLVLAVPFIAQWKRAMAGFAICAILLYGLRSRTMLKRCLWVLVAFVLFTLLLATPVLNYIGQAVAHNTVLSGLIPDDIEAHYSVFLRMVQTQQLLASTGGPSFLGTGLGSTLSWYDPYSQVVWEQETVDVGWIYILMKLGIVGLVVFVWLIGELLIKSLKGVPRGLHLSLVFLVVFFSIEMVAEAMFVYFMAAAWAGIACGFLHVMNRSRCQDHSLAPQAT